MALSRYGDRDPQLGQRIAVGDGQAFVPASVVVDEGGRPQLGRQVSGAFVPASVLVDDTGATVPGLGAATASHRLLSAAATTNATSVKASAGVVKSIRGHNAKASAVFLKLYNTAAAPAVGTDVPVVTLRLAPTADFAIDLGSGVRFSTGIGYGITGAAADADVTALLAGDVVAMNILYT